MIYQWWPKSNRPKSEPGNCNKAEWQLRHMFANISRERYYCRLLKGSFFLVHKMSYNKAEYIVYTTTNQWSKHVGKQLWSHNIPGYSHQENQLKMLHIHNQDTESKSKHADKSDKVRNDTESPSKVRTSKSCYCTTQQTKTIQQEGVEPQTHLHKKIKVATTQPTSSIKIMPN